MKDANYLLNLEKAIKEKYGDEAIQNPKKTWSPEKEKKYLEEIKKIYRETSDKDKIEVDGVLVPKKLIIKKSERTCPECNVYSFDIKDDLYMAKYKCCFRCYIQYVEGREEKWINSKLQKES